MPARRWDGPTDRPPHTRGTGDLPRQRRPRDRGECRAGPAKVIGAVPVGKEWPVATSTCSGDGSRACSGVTGSAPGPLNGTLEPRRDPCPSRSARATRPWLQAIGAARLAGRDRDCGGVGRPAHPCFRGAGWQPGTAIGQCSHAPDDSRGHPAYHTACLVFLLACNRGERLQFGRSCDASSRGPTPLLGARASRPSRRVGPQAGAEHPPALSRDAVRCARTCPRVRARQTPAWESVPAASRPIPRRWQPRACPSCRAGV